MKRILAALILAAAFCTGISAGTPVTYDLRVEAMDSPLGIDSAHPHFSWKNRTVQKTWQIQVASSMEALGAGAPDLWDSGVQTSQASVMVPYAGRELRSRELCWWRVCVNGEWSEPRRFSIGIIGDDAIGGEYIGACPGKSPVIYTGFKVKDPSRTAFLHITSLGYHEVYINGQRVSETVLAPAVSQMDKRSRIVTYDITPLLRRGKNEIAVWMGKGWYREGTFGAAFDGPLMNACIDVLGRDGWETVLTTGPSWKGVASGYTDMGSWRPGQFGGEEMDAAAVPAALDMSVLDTMSPEPATVVKVEGILATPQMCPANVLKEVVHAVSVEPCGDGRWIADMGKTMNAQLELHLRGGKAGSKVKISYCDAASTRGEDQGWGYDMLICSGNEDGDTFRSKFNHHVFRYVIIEGDCQRPALSDVRGQRFGSLAVKGGSFHSSDPDLDRIHDMITYTMDNLVFSGYMVDCASIERLGYGGDGNASALSLQTIFDAAPVYMNWLQAWEDTIGEDGHVRHTAPSPYKAGGGPYWCSYIVQAPWRMYMSYADTRLLERCYDEMLRWISYVDRYSVDGLLQKWPDDERRGWYLGDWLAPRGTDVNDPESVCLVSNCAVSQSYGELIRIASVLGRESDSRMFEKRKSELDSLIHSRFYHAGEGIYGTGSQLDMIYPMLVGAVPQELISKVEDKLYERTREVYDGHIGVGLVGVPVLAEWAARAGAADYVYGMLRQRTYPGYLYMLDNGATATWEDWDNPRSQLHNCYNGIGSWFYQALGGIIQDEPGYSHVTIAPQYPEGLNWVRVSQDTPYGIISVAWEKKDGAVSLHVEIPAGITAAIGGQEYTSGTYDLKG